MFRVVASLPADRPFAQNAVSAPDALEIWKATVKLFGEEAVWIERNGVRIEADQLRRELALLNLPTADTSDPKSDG